MVDKEETKRRPGRPKVNPEDRFSALTVTIPNKYIEEILFDMEAHGQVSKSAKLKEIIEYWLENCPDRIGKNIHRKRTAADYLPNIGR